MGMVNADAVRHARPTRVTAGYTEDNTETPTTIRDGNRGGYSASLSCINGIGGKDKVIHNRMERRK